VRLATLAVLASALVAAADTRLERGDAPGIAVDYVPPAAGSYRLPASAGFSERDYAAYLDSVRTLIE